MYAGLWGAPGGGPPPALAAALSPTAVSLGGLSKTHGLAGLRSGWLVTRDPAVRARLASAKDFTTICQSAPTEVLALIALRSGAALLARARAIVGANLPAVNAWFAARPALFWWSPPAGGGTTGVARLLGGERAASFCARALAGCGVLLLPLSEYHHPEAGGGAVGADCVRVGFARRDMPQVLAALGAWLDAGGAAAPPASGPGAATA